MSVECKRCGAPFRDPISPYQKFVQCKHCGCNIRLVTENSVEGKVVVVRELVVESPKQFMIDKFASFLTKRGLKSFDPVSGILELGNQHVVVSSDGAVSGTGPLKTRVERWIALFMSES